VVSPISGYEGWSTNPAFELRYSREMPRSMVGLIIGWRLGLYAGIDYGYFINRGTVAPFIGGGVGYHTIEGRSGQEVGGVELKVSTGLWLFRMKPIQLWIDLDCMAQFSDAPGTAIAVTAGLSY
jgi:opacity protein-like surface antigen